MAKISQIPPILNVASIVALKELLESEELMERANSFEESRKALNETIEQTCQVDEIGVKLQQASVDREKARVILGEAETKVQEMISQASEQSQEILRLMNEKREAADRDIETRSQEAKRQEDQLQAWKEDLDRRQGELTEAEEAVARVKDQNDRLQTAINAKAEKLQKEMEAGLELQ